MTMPPPLANQPSTMADKLLQALQLCNERTAQCKQAYRQLSKRLYQLNRRLASENRRLQEALQPQVQLQRSQRIDAMGEMAVKFAQELRNPLGSIVAAHRGAIQVNSRPGRGTPLILSFPLASAATERWRERAPASEQARGP